MCRLVRFTKAFLCIFSSPVFLIVLREENEENIACNDTTIKAEFVECKVGVKKEMRLKKRLLGIKAKDNLQFCNSS